jgi:acetyl esterase/lipase
MLNRSLALAALLVAHTVFAAAPKVVDLWPGIAPGEKGDIGPEGDMTKPNEGLVAGRRVMRIGNVSKPSMTIFKAAPDKDTGATVVIFPGGAYHILAWDLEGTEVAEWLNKNGVNAIVVKYRVPKREGLENYTAALQDAQRAVGLARANAKEWGIDPDRIGILGFSAGGHLSASLAAHTTERTYPKVDSADDASCAPNFVLLIYPAYLSIKEEGDKINPSVAVTPKHPKTFMVIAQNDPVRPENAIAYYLELTKNKVPAELHVYATGGHGYGLRESKELVTTWPDRALDWLRANGWLMKP